jgi:hypothetical protein
MPPLIPPWHINAAERANTSPEPGEKKFQFSQLRILHRKQLNQAARKVGLRAAPLAGINRAALRRFSLGFSGGLTVAVGPRY